MSESGKPPAIADIEQASHYAPADPEVTAVLTGAIPTRSVQQARAGAPWRANPYGGTLVEADDTLNDAIVNVYSYAARNPERLTTIERLDSFLARTVTNAAISTGRKEWRRQSPEGPRAIEEAANTIPTEYGQPEAAILQHELQDKVRAAIVQLPEQQRNAIILHYYYGLPYSKIAAELGCTVGTVKSSTSKARDRLGELLGEFAPKGARQAPAKQQKKPKH